MSHNEGQKVSPAYSRILSSDSEVLATEPRNSQWRATTQHSTYPGDSSLRDAHRQRDARSTASSPASSPSSRVFARTNADWLPYTLRGHFIWIPLALSFSLGLVTILLYWYSDTHLGLSPESSAMFGWKFAPTLVAVFYTQLTTMLFDDVKRTEPFARLAMPASNFPSASRTILEAPRQWWITLAHAFNKKINGGRRSWIIILSCVTNVIAFLLISPLSSALLGAENVRITQPLNTERLALSTASTASTLKLVEERDTYFRTLGALLQNSTTSPWISDEYSILPFWPAGFGTAKSPWEGQIASTPQTWEAETTVFRNDLHCSKFDLKGTDIRNTTPSMWGSDYELSITLESEGGCEYSLIRLAQDSSWVAMSSWAPIDHLARHNNYTFRSGVEMQPTYNDKCLGDEVIFTSTGWSNFYTWIHNETAVFSPTFSTNAQLCQSTHTMADLPVKISVSDSAFTVMFDEDAFNNAKKNVPDTVFNHSQFLELYTTPKWFEFIPSPLSTIAGASALLATQYDFNVTEMVYNASLPEQAARIRRRQFGELLRSSLDASGASQTERVTGQRTNFERRITVRLEAAAVLSGLFFLSFFMNIFIIWLSRLAQRPLHLSYDPATVLGVASLVASTGALNSLRQLDQATNGELKRALECKAYSTSAGRLHEHATKDQEGDNGFGIKTPSQDSKRIPVVLKRRTLLSFFLYLIALIITIAVVQNLAKKSRLQQGLFTYRIDFDKTGRLGSFAPISIFPTLLAVLLGLWWDGLDKAFRALQPYVSMSKNLVGIPRGAGVSYQSSYSFWAAGKAAKNKHWLLSLVTSGSFLAQAFIIAMSALFEQDTEISFFSVDLERTLELRQLPHLRQFNDSYPIDLSLENATRREYPYVEQPLSDLYTNLSTNWLYSGVIEATMNGVEPAWSRDGWSFVPINISHLDTSKIQAKPTKELNVNGVTAYQSSINITLNTPAIRGRVECHPIADLSNSSTWLEQGNYTDPRTNTTSLVSVPLKELFQGDYKTVFVPSAQVIDCCLNQSDPAQSEDRLVPTAVGYWTSNFPEDLWYTSVTGTNGNFTVKWLFGKGDVNFLPWDMIPDGFNYTMPDKLRLYFRTPPEMQALNCMPIIERAESEVIIDMQTQRVLSYQLINEPVPDQAAWTDEFIIHNLTDLADLPKNLSRMNEIEQNVTASYGVLFMNALLRASRREYLGTAKHAYTGFDDDDTDQAFNIRNNETGLNMDFMSYASYVQAGRNSEALLNYDTLLHYTQKTFTLFFQHFASSTVSLGTGGWVYQPINATFKDLGPPHRDTLPQVAPGGKPAVKYTDLPAQNTERNFTGTMSSRVEVLRMNAVAVWLSLSLLIWLTITMLVVAALQRWYFGDLRRNVESIADVMVLIAGSDRLLSLVQEMGVEGLMKSDVKTRLGWFLGSDGRLRWGIEVVKDGEVLVK